MTQQEKVVFITGCSTGIGYELAKTALAQGYKVIATARNKDSLQELIHHNENALALELDVTKSDQIKETIESAIAHFGKIDVLINNAGIGYFASVEESVEAEVRKMFEINFWGLQHTINAVLPHMRKQRSGHIINISSVAGIASSPTLGYYSATKFAVEGISASLAQEIKPFNIHVSVIEPGPFRTDWGGRSSAKTAPEIPDYVDTLKTVFDYMNNLDSNLIDGDPAKAADVILSITELDEPPLRLLLGTTAYNIAKETLTENLKMIETWKELTTTTEFDK